MKKKNKKSKVEVIRMPTSDKKCYICNGTGSILRFTMKNGRTVSEHCKTCEGTGIFKDNHYILITNGMAFSMDTIK